jgi:hypothetical protein
VLSALVGGRVGLIGGSLAGLNMALTTAIRYGHARRQFGPPRGAEIRACSLCVRPQCREG